MGVIALDLGLGLFLGLCLGFGLGLDLDTELLYCNSIDIHKMPQTMIINEITHEIQILHCQKITCI